MIHKYLDEEIGSRLVFLRMVRMGHGELMSFLFDGGWERKGDNIHREMPVLWTDTGILIGTP